MHSVVVRVPCQALRWAVALAAVLVVLLPLGAGNAVAAQDRAVDGGTFSWGVKESFRNYVAGFIARGTITPAGGATQATGNGVFTFTQGTGTVSPTGGAAIAFAGSVRFDGHAGDLDVTIGDPKVTVDAQGKGHIDVRHTVGGRSTTVRIADVTGAEVSTQGDKATLTGAKTTLTGAGMAVFSMEGSADSSFYAEGDGLDPASAAVGLKPEVTEPPDPEPTDPTDPEPTDPPTTEPTTPPTTSEPTPRPTPTTPKPTTPAAASGQLVWGVKSSFRSYIGGPVAQGKVTTSGHASTAGNGSYVFPQGSTSATPPSASGTTRYRGQVGFSGHHGELDMTLRNPRVVVTSSTKGTLVVDSRPTGATSYTTVTVSSLDLTKGTRSAGSGSVTYAGVPVSLSRAGTQLFAWGGNAMYPAGTAMDPVSFTIGADKEVSGGGTATTSRPKGSSSTSGSGDSNGTRAPSAAAGTSGAPAAAAPDSAGAGSLSWGLRTSFRDYITGPIAHGSISVSGGASSSGSAFTFPQSGAARTDGGAGYRGAVTFRGHGGILSVSLADPTVSIDSASRGTLTAQVSGQRMTIATLNLGASAKNTSGGATSYSNVPATLTAQGSTLFAYNGSSFYPAGTAMDPVTFTVGSASTAAASSSGSAQTVASAKDSTSSSSGAPASVVSARAGDAKAAADACVATGSDLTWGFKESFRSYISGSIANGEWSTSGGADYTTPNFVWSTGKGTFDEKTRTGSAAFPGTVTFTGHDGKLTTTVSDPEVRIEGDRALLVLDAEGATMDAAMEGRDDTKSHPSVPFVEVDLSQAKVETKGGRTTISADRAPTTLTPQGEIAFPNYTAGTAFDPISFTITAKSSCLAPAKTATQPPSDTDAAAISGPSAGSGSAGLPGWVSWAGGAGLGAVAAAGATLLIGRRRFGVTA